MKNINKYFWFALLTAGMLLTSCEKDDDLPEPFDTTGLIEVRMTRNLGDSRDQNNYDIAKEMCRIYPAQSDLYYYEVVRPGQTGVLYEKDGEVAQSGWYTDGERIRFFTGSRNVGTYGFTRDFKCQQ